MSGKKRLFTIIALVAILALLPTTALADFTVSGVTVDVPDSKTSCSPADTVSFTGITGSGKIVAYFFYLIDPDTGIPIELGSGQLADDASIPFPYPSITGTLTFEVLVQVWSPTYPNWTLLAKSSERWTVACEPTPPPPGGEGCTPGYWRTHFEDWPPTGYAPSYDFDATFGTNYFTSDITLGQAIWLGGGGVYKLARHGTAALLSAAHPDVDYPYTVVQVIAYVQAGNVDSLAEANELGCPIN